MGFRRARRRCVGLYDRGYHYCSEYTDPDYSLGNNDASAGGSMPNMQQSKASASLGECGSGESIRTSQVFV